MFLPQKVTLGPRGLTAARVASSQQHLQWKLLPEILPKPARPAPCRSRDQDAARGAAGRRGCTEQPEPGFEAPPLTCSLALTPLPEPTKGQFGCQPGE